MVSTRRRTYNSLAQVGRVTRRVASSPYGVAAFGVGALQGLRNAMTQTQTWRRNTGVRSGVGITAQYDRKGIYRKKRMPRKLRRRWRRFVQKVNATKDRDLGTRTVLFNSEVEVGNTNAGNDIVFSCGLYTLRGGAVTDVNHDLRNIATFEPTGDPTAAGGATIARTSKIMFHSGVMDITYRNTSTFKESETIEKVASDAQQELDVYEIYCREDFATNGANYANLGTAIDNEANQEPGIGGTASRITIVGRGATPFDCPTALSRLGIKILKKTKYFVPAGSTITYQMRDPKRHVALMREIADEAGANKPRWTRFLLFNIKLVPGLLVGDIVNTYQNRGYFGITRKYMYKIEGVMENRNRYVTSTYTAPNPS